NISGTNVKDFKSGLSKEQVRLVELTSKIQQDAVYRKFNTNRKFKRDEFFKKVYHTKEGDPILKESINAYLENYRQEIYKNIKGQNFFIMGSDGIPTWKEVQMVEEPIRVYFHFKREATKTIY